MVYLGIDYGDRRVGIAKSDSLGILATGLDTIIRKNNSDEDLASKICDVIKLYNVGKIILGLPRNMDGSEGFRAQKSYDFAKELEKQTNLEIVLWDERLTSVSAHRTMRELGIKTGNNKAMVDKIAACTILQSYLDGL